MTDDGRTGSAVRRRGKEFRSLQGEAADRLDPRQSRKDIDGQSESSGNKASSAANRWGLPAAARPGRRSSASRRRRTSAPTRRPPSAPAGPWTCSAFSAGLLERKRTMSRPVSLRVWSSSRELPLAEAARRHGNNRSRSIGIARRCRNSRRAARSRESALPLAPPSRATGTRSRRQGTPTVSRRRTGGARTCANQVFGSAPTYDQCYEFSWDRTLSCTR